MYFTDRCLPSGIKIGKAPIFQRNEKKPQKLTCAGIEMCWEEPTGFLLVEPFGSQKALWSMASIHKKIQSKKDLVLFQTSLGISKTFVDRRLIFLLSYTTLPWVYRFHLQTISVPCPYFCLWRIMPMCDLLKQLETLSLAFSLNCWSDCQHLMAQSS